MAMPPSVKVATAAIGVCLALAVVRGALTSIEAGAGAAGILNAGVGVALGGLIMVGLFKRHRLAWQWGRLVGVLLVLEMAVLWATGAVPSRSIGDVALRGFNAGALLLAVIALSFPSAKRFFRLVCPQCGKISGKAADFFFTRATCKACRLTF